MGERARAGWRRWRGGGATALAAGLVLLLAAAVGAGMVAPGRPAPELASGAWINSEPLTLQGLRGRVVLIDFWTYG